MLHLFALALALALVGPEPVHVDHHRHATHVAAEDEADRPPTVVFPPVERTPNWFFGGFVDVGYTYNSNLPENRLFRGQLTTPRTGELTLHQTSVYAEHDATADEPWHLALALQAGAAVDAIYATEPVPGGADGAFAGAEVFKHVGRANAGLLIRKSRTELRGGLMLSPLGIGTAWTKANWNYSTSWGANAAPYYLMGARVEQALARDWYLQAWVVNGWQTIADVNEVPSYLAGIVRDRGDWLMLSQVYFGPEGIDLHPRAWRVHWDTLAIYDGPGWGIGGVVDLGQEHHTDQPGTPQSLWLFGAAFVHGLLYQADHFQLDLAARPELMWDRDGLLYGTAQNLLIGETITLSGHVWDHLLVRLEYRYDRSLADSGFFYRGSATSNDAAGLATQQHSVLAGLVGYFERSVSIGGRH